MDARRRDGGSAWRPHFHEASDDAILLRVTDEPVMQRLGFYRVEEQA
jgi:Gentisate 1,2-dioxygenase